jgi:flagellar protein FlgJ
MEIPSLGIPETGVIAGEAGLGDLRRIAEGVKQAEDPESRIEVLRRAGEQFEAIFIRLLMREMRRTIPESNLFGQSENEKEIYEEIGDAALAEGLGRQRTLGIADMIVRQFGEKTAQDTSTAAFLAQRDRYLE